MKKIVICSALLVCNSVVFAQEVAKKQVSISEFSVSTGFQSAPAEQRPLTEFIAAAPTSSILKNDFSSLVHGSRYYRDGNENAFMGLLVGLKFKDSNSDKFMQKPIVRVGINYYKSSNFSNSYFSEVSVPYDTLTSSMNGSEIFVDSIYAQSLYIKQKSQNVRLDAAVIFHTNEKFRFGLHVGIGITAGFDISNVLQIRYNEDRHPSIGGYSGNGTIIGWQSTEEKIGLSNGFAGSIYVPFGFGVRLGKENEFWKHVHLFVENRPSLTYVSSRDFKSFAALRFTGMGGVRITL